MNEFFPGRSDANRTYRLFKSSGVRPLRCPTDEQSPEHLASHRAEHYARVGVLIHRLVTTTMEKRSSRIPYGLINFDGDTIDKYDSASEIRRYMLATFFHDANEMKGTADYQAVETSIRHMHQIDDARFSNLYLNLSAGVETAVNTMEALFEKMDDLGEGQDTMIKNWRVLNEIARMHIFRMLALRDHYLENPKANPLVTVDDRIVIDDDILDALAIGPADERKHMSYDEHLRPTIGCPITFEPALLRELWKWYVDLRCELPK